MQILGPGPCVRLLYNCWWEIYAQLKKDKGHQLYHTPGKISKKKSSEITRTILGASSQDW